MTRFAFVWVEHDGSDWVGIYRDGVKIKEGHRVVDEEGAKILGVEVETYVFPPEALRQPNHRGLPETLEEVKRHVD